MGLWYKYLDHTIHLAVVHERESITAKYRTSIIIFSDALVTTWLYVTNIVTLLNCIDKSYNVTRIIKNYLQIETAELLVLFWKSLMLLKLLKSLLAKRLAFSWIFLPFYKGPVVAQRTVWHCYKTNYNWHDIWKALSCFKAVQAVVFFLTLSSA